MAGGRDQATLPAHLLQRLEDEILDDEVVVWTGRPSVSRSMLKSAGQGLLGVALICIAIILLVSFINSAPVNLVSNLILLPGEVLCLLLLLFGVYLCYSPFISCKIAKGVLYAVTNLRAMIISRERIDSYFSYDIDQVQRIDLKNGLGDVLFYTVDRSYRDKTGRLRVFATRDGYIGVVDPTTAECAIRNIIAGVTGSNFKPVEQEQSGL